MGWLLWIASLLLFGKRFCIAGGAGERDGHVFTTWHLKSGLAFELMKG